MAIIVSTDRKLSFFSGLHLFQILKRAVAESSGWYMP